MIQPNTDESEARAIKPGDRFLRLPQVLTKTGRGRTSTLDDVKAGRFPAPVRQGRATMWIESEIDEWMAQVVRQSREVRKC